MKAIQRLTRDWRTMGLIAAGRTMLDRSFHPGNVVTCQPLPECLLCSILHVLSPVIVSRLYGVQKQVGHLPPVVILELELEPLEPITHHILGKWHTLELNPVLNIIITKSGMV